MNEDNINLKYGIEESCNPKWSMLRNEIETQNMEIQETEEDIDRNEAKKDNVRKKLKHILYSTHYCSLCTKTESALMSKYKRLKIHGIQGDGENKVSIKEVLTNIFPDISGLLATSYICLSCVDDAVQAYIFIQKSKRSVNIISEYVTKFQSQLSLLEDLIDLNEDYSSSKYLIVIEPSMSEVCESTSEFCKSTNEVSESISEVITEKTKEDYRTLNPKNPKELKKEVTGPTLILDGTKDTLEVRNEVKITKISPVTKEQVDKQDVKENSAVKCKICFKTSSSPKSLVLHYKNHNRSKCRICKMFVLNSQLQLHLNLHHKDSVYSCDYCNRVYHTETAFMKHIEAHWRKYNGNVDDFVHQCVECLKWFTEETVLTHLCKYKCGECDVWPCIHSKYLFIFRENISIPAWNCPDCKYLYYGKFDLIEHVNQVHLDFHQHKCNICGIEYYSKTKLDAHKTYVHSQDSVCRYCDQVFQDANEFSNHNIEMCKADYRKFKCDECEASFDTSNMLGIHKDVRHKEFPCFKTFNNDTKDLSKTVLECPVCKMAFEYKSDYKQHIMKVHGPNYTCDDCNENFKELNEFLLHYNQQHSESLVCEICGKSFKTQRKLTLHRRTGHTEPLQCHICTKMIRPTSMKSHMNWHKVQENPSLKKPVEPRFYKCDICGQLVTTKIFLKSHINRYHLKVKPFKCRVCGVAYSCNYQLKQHTISHSEEKWHKCTICDKKLRNRVCLKKHMMLHTGERPHICDICGEGFITVTRLKEHVNRHSGKKLNCPLCNSKFDMIKNLRYHIKQRHWDNKDKPFDRSLVKGLTEEHDYIFQDGRTVNRQ